MPVVSSLRPDFSRTVNGKTDCLCPKRHRGKSGRCELVTDDCATDVWHPFSCSYQRGLTSCGRTTNIQGCITPSKSNSVHDLRHNPNRRQAVPRRVGKDYQNSEHAW